MGIPRPWLCHARFRPLAYAVSGVLLLAAPLVGSPPAATAAVPPSGAQAAVITVKSGGDRTTANAIAPLPGVTMRLYDGTDDPTTAVAASWATCVSDADGDCSFTVPDTDVGGANRDRRFWVVETGTPTGWTSNQSLVTGPGSGPFVSRRYTFRTQPQLRSQTTYATTGSADFMRTTGDTNPVASGGIWQHSRTDPALVSRCGVRVALVIDVSGSVRPDLDDLKSAASTFVDSLAGTPSSVALYTFNATAPANDSNDQTRPPTAVSTPDGAARVKGYIDGLTASSNTNWDRGLYQVAVSTAAYDVAVVITDGNPTVYSNSPVQGPGSYTRFREVESGIASANALKAKGTRIVTVGVGAGVADGADNLRAISGTTRNSDFFQTASYAQAGANLRQLAIGSCVGTLTVVKEVVPPGGTPAQATVSGGWTMTASNPSSGVSVTTAATAVTRGGTGAVNYGLTFAGGTADGQVSVTETQQAGYTLLPQDGANATCRRTDTGDPTAVVDDGALGFRAAVSADYPVTCVVLNEAPEPPATAVLNKVWVINGERFAEGDQPPDFVAQARLAGTTVAWGSVRTGFAAGNTPSVTEDPVALAVTRPGCRLDSSRLTDRNGTAVDQALPQSPTLVAGDNTFTVTNTVTCVTRLRLVKDVRGGTAQPSAWDLSATAPDSSSLPFTTGTSGVEGTITSNVGYVLSESGGDPAYEPLVRPDAVIAPGASGSWSCVELAADGTTVIPGFTDGFNGRVTARRGAFVRCTAVNSTATLRLRKLVQNTHGGTAVPADWNLTATPVDPPAGLGPVTVTGAEAYAGFSVRPGVRYRLSESGGPSGYALEDLSCSTDTEDPPAATTVFTVAPLDTASCTFTNADQPARLTLRKVVDAGTTGSTRTPADWDLTATPQDIDGQDAVTGNGDPTNADGVSAVPVSAGTYTLGETGPAGFTAGTWSCTGGAVTGAVVVVPTGAAVTCSITNTAVGPTLTLVKQVVNDDGGTAAPTDWTLTAAGPATLRGASGAAAVTAAAAPVGRYVLSEAGPAGYAASDWVCTGAVGDGRSVTLTEGESAVCTVTNDDDPTSWTLSKRSDPVSGSMVEPGSVVTYTLTATDTGAGPVLGATVTDDLSDVLDHASLDAVPDGATLSGTTLTWAVPPLTSDDDVATLTYSVTVDDGADDVELTNVARPSSVGGRCLGCTTVDRTTPRDPGSPGSAPPLASTGGPGLGIPLLGLLLVLTGTAAVWRSRRRG